MPSPYSFHSDDLAERPLDALAEDALSATASPPGAAPASVPSEVTVVVPPRNGPHEADVAGGAGHGLDDRSARGSPSPEEEEHSSAEVSDDDDDGPDGHGRATDVMSHETEHVADMSPRGEPVHLSAEALTRVSLPPGCTINVQQHFHQRVKHRHYHGSAGMNLKLCTITVTIAT